MAGREQEDVVSIELSSEINSVLDDNRGIAKSYGEVSIRAFFSSPYVIMSSASAAIGGFLFGFDQGLISIILTLPRFLELFPEIDPALNANAGFNKGMMTALLELGAAFGALQSGYAADKISRRYVLLLGTVWFIIGSTLQTSAFHFVQLVLGRFIGGVGIGTLACVAPLFIGEIAPPHLRGSMLVFESWMVVLGVVIAFYVTYGTRVLDSDWAFRLPFLIQMLPALVLAGLIYFMPFSPRWLCLKGRDRESLATLCKLRQLPSSDVRVQAEWLTIRADIKANKLAQDLRHPSLLNPKTSGLRREVLGWLDCFGPGVFRRTIIGVGLQFFQQFIGINAIVYYAPTLFAALGFNYETQLTLSGITNIMQLVGVTPTFFILDRVGRRPLLLGGSILATTCLLVTGIITALCYKDWPAHPNEAKVGVAFLMIFMVVFGASWAPIPWAMPPEVLSSSYRSKGTALAVVSNWVNNFIVGLITPILVEKTNGIGAFFLFAGFSALSFVFVFFLVPETMGVSLEDMDAKFGNSLSQEDEKRKHEIMQDLLNQHVPPSVEPSSNKDDAKYEVEHLEVNGR